LKFGLKVEYMYIKCCRSICPWHRGWKNSEAYLLSATWSCRYPPNLTVCITSYYSNSSNLSESTSLYITSSR